MDLKDAKALPDRYRICRACGHDLVTQHDPEDETCDAFGGMDVGVCPCGRSSVTVGDRRLSHVEREAYEHQQYLRADAFAAILRDLDRCEHGRHEGDTCNGCGGPSHGNPILPREVPDDRPPQVFMVARPLPRQIGYDISGRPIVVPERARLHDADAWTQPR